MASDPTITPKLWERWDDGDVNFFRYCPFVYSNFESEPHPCDSVEYDDNAVQYMSGISRLALRHTPLVVYIIMLFLFYFFAWNGQITPTGLILGFIGVLLVVAHVSAYRSDASDSVRARVQAVGNAVIFVVLLVATGTYIRFIFLDIGESSTVPTWLIENPDLGQWTGYLFLLYAGGMLVYDGMLRTENLLCKLGEREILNNNGAYGDLLEELQKQMKINTWISGSFRQKGVVLISFGFLLWAMAPDILAKGLFWNIPIILHHVILFATRALIVIVAFKFIILVNFIYKLVKYQEDQSVQLVYHPFHPDGTGGFRDIGKFAKRVNLLILIGGMYLLFFSLGDPVADSAKGPFTSFTFISWSVYFGILLLWFYFSILPLHHRMVRDREEWLKKGKFPSHLYEEDDCTECGFNDHPSWEALQQAPTWPLNTRQLTRIASANLTPFVLWVLKFAVGSGVLENAPI